VAPDPYLAVYGTQGRYLGLTFVIDMTVLYLAVAVAFRTRTNWTILFTALAGAVALSLGYAWAQHSGADPLPWSTSAQARPFSTIGNPNTYGHLLSVALAPSAACAILCDGCWRSPVRLSAACFAVAIVIVE